MQAHISEERSRYTIVKKCDIYWNSKNIQNCQFTTPITISWWKYAIYYLMGYSTGRQFDTYWEHEHFYIVRLCTSNLFEGPPPSPSSSLKLFKLLVAQMLKYKHLPRFLNIIYFKITDQAYHPKPQTFTQICVLTLLTTQRAGWSRDEICFGNYLPLQVKAEATISRNFVESLFNWSALRL